MSIALSTSKNDKIKPMMNFGKFQKVLTFVLIFGWIFSGWPQISGFPPKIQKT